MASFIAPDVRSANVHAFFLIFTYIEIVEQENQRTDEAKQREDVGGSHQMMQEQSQKANEAKATLTLTPQATSQ